MVCYYLCLHNDIYYLVRHTLRIVLAEEEVVDHNPHSCVDAGGMLLVPHSQGIKRFQLRFLGDSKYG